MLAGGYPNQSCSYSCAPVFYEYLPPQTEVYSTAPIGGRPVRACIESDGSVRFTQIDCEVLANSSSISKVVFNPPAAMFSDGRM